MDYDRASAALGEYEQLVKKAQGMPWLSGERRAATRELNERLPAINAVLRSLGPSAGWVSGTALRDHAAGLNRIGNARRLLSSARTLADTANELGAKRK